MAFCLPVIFKAIIMGAACFATACFFTSPGLQLAVGIVSGIIVYWLVSALTRDESLSDIKDILLRKRKSGES